MNLKLIDEVSAELHKNYQLLKEVVTKGMEWHALVLNLSASLEYLKYVGRRGLPTQFMEAEMEFFGAHSCDQWGFEGDDPGTREKGAHHYEWRPAQLDQSMNAGCESTEVTPTVQTSSRL